MANTALPTNIQAGATGRIAQTNIVHAEINQLSQDTGWRIVTDFLVNGWTANSVILRRIRGEVYLTVTGLNGAAATNSRFLAFGSGGIDTRFRPNAVTTALGRFQAPGFDFGFAFTSSSGIAAFMNEGTNTGTGAAAYSIPMRWATRHDFPPASAWPGTAL